LWRADARQFDFTPDLIEKTLKKQGTNAQPNNPSISQGGDEKQNGLLTKVVNAFVAEILWLKMLNEFVIMFLAVLAKIYYKVYPRVPLTLKLLLKINRFIKAPFGVIRINPKLIKKIFNNPKRFFKHAINSMIVNRRTIHSSRDTGYLIYDSFVLKRKCNYGLVLPTVRYSRDFRDYFHLRDKLLRWIELFVPDRLSYLPKRKGSISKVEFKDIGYPDLAFFEWEEYFWTGKPFGFHLKKNRRKDCGAGDDITELKRTLGAILKI
jgi:hypothetical protein